MIKKNPVFLRGMNMFFFPRIFKGCYVKTRNFQKCKEAKFPKKRWLFLLRNLLPSNLYHLPTVFLLQTTVKEKCNSDKYTFTEIVYTATNTNYGVFFLLRYKNP